MAAKQAKMAPEVVLECALRGLQKNTSAEYQAGFLNTLLQCAIEYMPPAQAKKFAAHVDELIGKTVEVEVVSLMTGAPVKIKLNERGGPCDPSMERYWAM